ncbi:MAG: methylated-DNA--[protein]-cysteine S-methyltransferase [Muribaculaceae bacterium]|nr:methylated-DNA--[protein]-cysteine S-methyltransferase [Muribaculaceae bacterium]
MAATTYLSKIITSVYESACGPLIIGASDVSLCLCDWLDNKKRGIVHNRLRRILNAELIEGNCEVIEKAFILLDEYFAGKGPKFDIPLIFAGSEFQKKVWKRLLDIPLGESITYKELAEEIGMPTAVRAVANAVGANPISIFVPCHRVIGSDGSLTGYAGGINAKKYLLGLEN